jgi:hypothetical protein
MPKPPALARWVGLCAAAEAVGMTSAAAAARAAAAVGGTGGWPTAARLGLVIGGGLVEGVALGVLQYVGLRRWLPALRRRAWVTVTVVVAGLGWGLASAPGALSADSGAGGGVGEGPPRALVIAGALALGAVMGAALGAAQALVLRAQVRRPGQWVAANAVAWTPAMAVIFVGATTPDRSWGTPAVIVLGTLTGALAGTVLGAVTGLWLPTLTPARAPALHGAAARSGPRRVQGWCLTRVVS